MDLIDKFLEEEMGFGDAYLYMGGLLAKELGDVDTNKIDALRLTISNLDEVPPEISYRGLRNVGVYLTSLGYINAREIMLRACRKIIKT